MEKWTEIINSRSKNSFSFRKILNSRDLVSLLVRRDFVKEFKQTILGPIWFVIQPIFQTLVLLFVFGNIGQMGPDGIPQISFYLGGTIIWNIFSDTVLKTSETFRMNAPMFSKVYFPRLVVPISIVMTNYVKLGVQFIIFIAAYTYEYIFYGGFEPQWTIVLFPFFIVLASLCGLGLGLIISAMTTKYWDLRFLVQFGMQLLMFMSTVITPLYVLDQSPQWMRVLIIANPISSFIEAFRYSFLGIQGGWFYINGLMYSIIFTFIVLFLGIRIFVKVERNFVDTV